MKISKLIWFIIVFLVGIIFLQRQCSPRKQIKYIPKIDTVYQRHDSLIYVPKDSIVFRDTGSMKLIVVHDTIPLPLLTDTLGMVLDYLRMRVIKDTALKDSNVLVIIVDTIQRNRLKSRKKIIHYYITYKEKKVKLHNKFYLGIGVGGNYDDFGFAGKVLFQNKKQQLFGLSYDPLNHYWEVSTYWLLKFRKRK